MQFLHPRQRENQLEPVQIFSFVPESQIALSPIVLPRKTGRILDSGTRLLLENLKLLLLLLVLVQTYKFQRVFQDSLAGV